MVRAAFCLAVCMLGAGIFAMAQRPRIIEFDAPGAGNTPGSGFGTQGEDINPAGAITGMYADSNNVMHGFLRAKHGAITTFDVPGAGTEAGQGTFPLDNNPGEMITGVYIDASSVYHGFLRTP